MVSLLHFGGLSYITNTFTKYCYSLLLTMKWQSADITDNKSYIYFKYVIIRADYDNI